ncbi:MAG: hypothetical protein AAGB16_03335, partial [Pseudomonadota bacterium]
MRKLWVVALLLGVYLYSVQNANAFGGEDIAQGKPWHHENITLRALTKPTGDDAKIYDPEVIFSGSAAQAIAWHADNIDSYLYNPYFWAKGFFNASSNDRTTAALVGFKDLAKLHFDDTFSTGGITANWERYGMGTLIGLVWASELETAEERVAAGHHILGVSFHAIQDFYSHSNWVTNTNRRCHTYFELPEDNRTGMSLWSGAYESSLANAPAHHGAYSISCSVLRGDTMDEVLGAMCGGYSPFQNSGVCLGFKGCGGAAAIDVNLDTPITQNGVRIYLNPAGIALDNTPMSRVQAPNRSLTDRAGTFLPMKDGLHFPKERCTKIIKSELGNVCELDADHIFAGTKDLAIRATMEWAIYLEEQMGALGLSGYWRELKGRGSNDYGRFSQFEDFSKLPYQFLAAGDYPVGNPRREPGDAPSEAKGWFLRLRIKTANELGAGTDADIVARVKTPSRTYEQLLDYLPTNDQEGIVNNRLLVYNDFERGKDDAYVIGPFHERPVSVQLVNKSAGFGDLLDAAITDFANGVSETLTDARRMLISIVGGQADHIGDGFHRYTTEQLKPEFESTRGRYLTKKVEIRGGSDGDHDVYYLMRSVPGQLTRQQREDGWMAIEVELQKLHTIKESTVDRFSTADEPFVIFHVAGLNNLNDRAFTYMSEPFDDMDDNEQERFPNIRATRSVSKIPPEGMLAISVSMFESDDENEGDREVLKRRFVTGMDRKTQRAAAEFTDALGRAIAEDWVVDRVDVFAFQRSAYPLAGQVFSRSGIGEIEGGEESDVFELNWRNTLVDFGRRGVKPVLTFERPHPDARTVLTGKWHSKEYQCAKDIPYVGVEVELEGDDPDKVIATKVEYEGDECVDDIENGKTFKGEFNDEGHLIGERYIVPPPRDRLIEFDPENPLHVKPDWEDPSIDPNLNLEGNWFIMFNNSSSPYMMATLSKGGGIRSHDLVEEGYSHIHWSRNPDAYWSVNFWKPSDGGYYLHNSDSVNISGSSMKVEWPYYHLGHWGGDSELSISENSFAGQWLYGQGDNQEKGSEQWIRLVPKINAVGTPREDGEEVKPLGDPVTINTEYRGHIASLRGNRDQIVLNLYGPNLFGEHRYFISAHTDIELRGASYICNQPHGFGYEGSKLHGDWRICMQNGGGVAGLRFVMTVWPRATSGPHVIYVNDQEVPFNLNVINEPLREAEWQDMEMVFESCSVLRE